MGANLTALAEHATPAEIKYLKAVAQYGSTRKAAAALRCHHSTVGHAITRLRKRAARADPSLHAMGAPQGYHLRGVSTFRKFVDDNGSEYSQWIKTDVDKTNRVEMVRAAIADIVEANRGALKPVKKSVDGCKDNLAVYPLADAHVGMHAWAEEAGEDFDLKIAERMYTQTQDALVSMVPRTDRALLINLGDYLHADNRTSRTESGGNLLDTDSRFGKIIRVAIRMLQRMIARLLERHQHVDVWMLAGNHDENTALVLAVAFEAIYANEPRVTVSINPARFQVLEWGRNLIGAAHGHTASLRVLPSVMATRWPEAWGRTKDGGRIWYTGHVHHDSVRADEAGGCLVETLRTGAPRDAWHSGKGYFAGRDLKCDLWHKTTGRGARLYQPMIGGLT